MSKDEMILALGNALILLDRVWTVGEVNMDNQSNAIKQVRAVFRALKQEGGEAHDDPA